MVPNTYFNKNGEVIIDIPADFDIVGSGLVVAMILDGKNYIKSNKIRKTFFSPFEDAVGQGTRGRFAQQDWEFRQVNGDCFQNYIRFLQTKKSMWKFIAERHMINGKV